MFTKSANKFVVYCGLLGALVPRFAGAVEQLSPYSAAKIRLKGELIVYTTTWSQPLARAWTKEFATYYPGVKVKLGTLPTEIEQPSFDLIVASGGVPDTSLLFGPRNKQLALNVAHATIQFVARVSSPIKSISLEALKNALTRDKPPKIGSLTRGYLHVDEQVNLAVLDSPLWSDPNLQGRLPMVRQFPGWVKKFKDPQTFYNYVKDENAFGLMIGSPQSSGLRSLPLASSDQKIAVTPTTVQFYKGSYPLAHPIRLSVLGTLKGSDGGLTAEFLRFVQSDEGQRAAIRLGYESIGSQEVFGQI